MLIDPPAITMDDETVVHAPGRVFDGAPAAAIPTVDVIVNSVGCRCNQHFQQLL